MHHILSEDVNVGHRRGADRSSRFAVSRTEPSSGGSAAQTAAEKPRIVLLLLPDNMQQHHLS